MKRALFFLFVLFFSKNLLGIANEKSIRFAIFGDCHLQDITSEDETVLSKIIKDINLQQSIDFAVCTGDIVGYPSSVDEKKYNEAIDKYLKITTNLKVPLYTIPGNHDLEGNEKTKRIFVEKIGQLYFSAEKNNFLLILPSKMMY